MFDCFGAGQQVVQVTFGGADWRTAPELAGVMFAVLPATLLQLRRHPGFVCGAALSLR